MAESNQVNVQEARTFLASIGHSADTIKTMPDPEVTKLYTGATEFLTKEFAPKAVPFGEKWREALAADDPKAMETLGRLKTPGDLWKSYSELRGKMASGELKSTSPFPAKGAPDEQAAWRKEHGIPEKPEGYDVKLENGVMIGELDKPMVDNFLKFAHSNNIPPAEAKGMMQWYFGEMIPAQEKMIAEQTRQREAETAKALEKAWGPDLKRNLTAAENMVNHFFPADAEDNGNVRSRTLNAMKQDPAFAQVMATLALQLDPTSTLTLPSGHSDLKSIEGRLAEIDAARRKDRAAYNRDEKMQAEERELLDAKAVFESRAKGVK